MFFLSFPPFSDHANDEFWISHLNRQTATGSLEFLLYADFDYEPNGYE